MSNENAVLGWILGVLVVGYTFITLMIVALAFLGASTSPADIAISKPVSCAEYVAQSRGCSLEDAAALCRALRRGGNKATRNVWDSSKACPAPTSQPSCNRFLCPRKESLK